MQVYWEFNVVFVFFSLCPNKLSNTGWVDFAAFLLTVVTMARFELFQSQSTLVVSLLTDSVKHEIRKAFTFSSDESSLSIKPNDAQIQMVRKSVKWF